MEKPLHKYGLAKIGSRMFHHIILRDESSRVKRTLELGVMVRPPEFELGIAGLEGFHLFFIPNQIDDGLSIDLHHNIV